MVADGADLLDVGGESTRPGAQALDAAEERRRVLPVIEGLAAQGQRPNLCGHLQSLDRSEPRSMRARSMVNDISGLRYEPDLARSWRERGAPIILMHTRGRSKDMYKQAVYNEVVDEVLDELRESIAFAGGAGIAKDVVLVDPGLGFAKEPTHNYEVLGRLGEFSDLGRPLVVGPSRKGFLTRPLPREISATERDWPTAAAVTAAVLAGAHIVRVHAVREMVPVVRVADEIRKYHREH